MNGNYFDRIQRLENPSVSQTWADPHFKRVLQFLRDARRHSVKPQCNDAALIYNLGGDERPVPLPFTSYRQQSEHHASACNQLLFLSGYPSAPLLEDIGEYFDLDPGFFNSHLSFVGEDTTSCSIHPSYYTLPSGQHTVFQTSVTSIGGVHGDSLYESLALKRDSFTSQMQDYLHNLKLGKSWTPFDSIVRGVEVHDTDRFSLEQSVTILIKYKKEHPDNWLIIIWSDAGADLSKSPRGPWLESTYAPFNTHFRPISLGSSNIYNKPYKYSREIHINQTKSSGPRQSIQLIPKAYGSTLDHVRMATKPIYLLSELLSFIAISETYYLDMIKSVLDDNTPLTYSGTAKTHRDIRGTLVFSYRALERRRDRITAMLEFMAAHGVPSGGLSNLHQCNEHDKELIYICHDYEYLLGIIDCLKKRCDHELNVMMSEAAVNDAEWSKAQSKSTHKFTVLATVYVPLSFSCAVFGMNFVTIKSLGTGFLVWVGLTLFLLMLTLGLLAWDRKAVTRIVERVNLSRKSRIK